MTLISAAFVVCMAFLTATLSGVFGMAGGLVLMGALAFVLPVQAAFVTHGLLQLVANGWRAILHRNHVRWDIVGWYALASAVAAGAVWLLTFTPSKPLLFLLLGLVPFLTWLPQRWISLDAARPAQAFVSGLSVTGLNLTAGVAGAPLGIFFLPTPPARHALLPTQAAPPGVSPPSKIPGFCAPPGRRAPGGGAPAAGGWARRGGRGGKGGGGGPRLRGDGPSRELRPHATRTVSPPTRGWS